MQSGSITPLEHEDSELLKLLRATLKRFHCIVMNIIELCFHFIAIF